MERKKTLNKDKDMSTLYGKLGMVPEKLEEQESPHLLQGYHYQKIQRNLYRYQHGLDYQQLAEDSFLLSAEKGDSEGMYQYGLCCLDHRTPEKEAEGLNYLQKSAQLQHRDAMFQLGEYHRHRRQYTIANQWYQKSAQLSHPEALFFQGFLPIYCENLPFHQEETQILLEKAREKGSIEVLFYDLAQFKAEGQVDQQRKTQEILLEALFQKVEQHPAVIFYRLGMGYLKDLFLWEESQENLAQKPPKTQNFLEESVTSKEMEEDFAQKQEQLRRKPLMTQALRYLKESACLNYHKAQLELSDHYFKVRRPCPYHYQADPQEGGKWLSFAMKNKSPHAFALFSLLCEHGLLEVKTPEELGQLDQLSQQLGSMLGAIRQIEKKATTNPQEKDSIFQEGITEFFQGERPIFYWHDIGQTITNPQEKVDFLEEVRQRLPHLPALNDPYHKIPLYSALLLSYVELGEMEKASALLTEELPEITVLYLHSIYFRTKSPPMKAYSFNFAKGVYYEAIGALETAIACYEKASSQDDSSWLSTKEPLSRLYKITKNPEKLLEITQGFVVKDISPQEWNLIYPLLRDNPEKKQGDSTYASLFQEYEESLLGKMELFTDYFKEKLAKLSLPEEKEFLLTCLENWQLKEDGVPFFVQALEDYGKRTDSPQVMCHLACIYHPDLPYLNQDAKLKAVKNHEKSLFYWNLLLEPGRYTAQEIFGNPWYNMSRAVEKYLGLCYLEQENPQHLTPLQDLWAEFDPESKWNLWFQRGYYGIATLYQDEKYHCKDEGKQQQLLYQGVETGEEDCYFPLINLQEKNMAFDEMKRLLQIQVAAENHSAQRRLGGLYLRLKEYEEAYHAFRHLSLSSDLAHHPSHESDVLQWVAVMETIEKSEIVESIWFGEEEKEEIFALLHDLALGEDKQGDCSRKISLLYRNGQCCAVNFKKSLDYLTQRVEREPLSSENQSLTKVQQGLYHDLGIVYYREDNPYRNEGKAKVYLQLANCDYAHYFLFLLFKKEENHQKAFFHGEKYVRQVGKRGYNAMTGQCDLYLGECYETGKAVKQNLHKAKELYEKVSGYGLKEATEKLKRWE